MLPQGGNIYHSVGFGDSSGGSSGAGGHARPPGNVQTGGSGFDNSLYASASANPSATKRAEPPPDFIPVEIIFKPRPEYTDVARREKIEGEVLLEALFTAGGQITNIRVQQGLGYGLNEMAVKAAQQIQFKPAKKNGAPVDSVAAIRIIFKLAY
jgi:protein TonB